jgi:hypothetical protein
MANIYDMTDTWNNGATTYTAIKMDVSDAASASGSKLMDLQVDGSSKVVINKSGSVGIGVSSPATALDVVGAGGGNVQATISDGANQGNLQLSKSANYFGLKAGIDYGGLLFFSNSATESMRIDSSGNVGIGLSNPQFYGKAAIQGGKAGTENSNLSLLTDGVAQGELAGLSLYGTFEGTADNGPRRTADIVAGFEGGTWGTEYLAFHVGIGGQNDNRLLTTERVRIDGSGNVGIGVTSPAAKLEIGGSGEGIILASPDGTRYKITVANGGTLTVTAV